MNQPNRRRRITVAVTSRATYSRIRTALRAIDAHSDLELQLVLAASVLLDRFGNASSLIEADGFKPIARVFNSLEGATPTLMAKTMGLGVMELASVFENHPSDIVVSVADRYETLSTAVAAAYMNIPLAHIQGGEVTGSIDEKVRHAKTKLADYHLVSTDKAAQRVIKLGENPDNVIKTGCPSIDLAAEVSNENCRPFDPYVHYGGVGPTPSLDDGYLVVLQHPVTTEHAQAEVQATCLLDVIRQAGRPTLWFWPNIDAGSDGTSRAIRRHREFHPKTPIHFFKNMEGKDFLRTLRRADCLVGNSSVGIRECSFLGVPVVNIGSRQAGRERGPNVRDVPEWDPQAIQQALAEQCQSSHYRPSTLYGDGRAGPRIAEALLEMPLQCEKRLTY